MDLNSLLNPAEITQPLSRIFRIRDLLNPEPEHQQILIVSRLLSEIAVSRELGSRPDLDLISGEIGTLGRALGAKSDLDCSGALM
jgi:hypothetical protein